MAETRKGVFTPEQEKVLDDVLKFNNKLLETVDGPAISLIDNQGLDRLKAQLIAKYPGSEEILFQIIDLLMAGLAELVKEPE